MTAATPPESCTICGAATNRLGSNRPLHKGRGTTLLICRDCTAGVGAAFGDDTSPGGPWRLIMADCAWCGSGGVAVASHGDYAICEDCALICHSCLQDR